MKNYTKGLIFAFFTGLACAFLADNYPHMGHVINTLLGVTLFVAFLSIIFGVVDITDPS